MISSSCLLRLFVENYFTVSFLLLFKKFSFVKIFQRPYVFFTTMQHKYSLAFALLLVRLFITCLSLEIRYIFLFFWNLEVTWPHSIIYLSQYLLVSIPVNNIEAKKVDISYIFRRCGIKSWKVLAIKNSFNHYSHVTILFS